MHNTQYNDTQHNETLHNDTLHNDTLRYETLYYDTAPLTLKCYFFTTKTDHIKRYQTTSVVMLNVMAPENVLYSIKI